MQSDSIHWPINAASMARSLRALWALTTLGFACVIHKIRLDDARPDIVFLISLVAVVFFYSTLMAYRRNITQKITIDRDAVEVPRLLLKRRRILIRNIGSVNVYKHRDKNQAISINLTSGRQIPIDKSLFISAASFDCFVEQIQAARNNLRQPQETTIIFCAAGSVLRNHILGIVVTTIICIAFLAFSQNVEEISPSGVQIAGLTKDALAPNEWYRLFSSFFLHDNLLHLGLNVMALGIFLQPVELMIGKVQALNVLLASSFISAIFSVLFSPYEYVIGASGGILGLMGACSVFYFRYKKELTSQTIISGKLLLVAVGAQVMGDFLIPSVDVASHLAGFSVGAVCGQLIPGRFIPKKHTAHPSEAKAIAALLTLAFTLSLVYSTWQFINS